MTAFFNSNNCFINLNQAVWWMKRFCYDTLVTYTYGWFLSGTNDGYY